MKLKFAINYRTEWGQQLVVCIGYTLQDGSTRNVQLTLITQDGDQWNGETAILESRRSPIQAFTYYYIVADSEGRELRREWTFEPRIYVFDASKTFIFSDQWQEIPLNAHLYTKAYEVTTDGQSTDCAEDDMQISRLRLPLFRKTVLFRVSAPQLQRGQMLAIVGNHPALGSWNPSRYLLMNHIGRKTWMLSLNVDWIGMPLEYKYVVVDKETHELLAWEDGLNREVTGSLVEGEVFVANGEPLRLAEKYWRAAGVCVPVFSLRSEQSCGVGDFGDLKRLVDWAVITGMKVIQILPVTDTTVNHQWRDSNPYKIVSAFALHPHYLDLNQLGKLKDKQRMTVFLRQQRELNALQYSDFEAVDRVKNGYVHHYFEEKGSEMLRSTDFHSWMAENRWWLEPYLNGKEKTTNQQETNTSVRLTRDEEAFVQYHLHQQLKAAADYARKVGVILKGDLPIGVCEKSVETEEHPNLFNKDSSIGAPPDVFSIHGQNWGSPSYNWEYTSEKNNESVAEWLRQRMHHMEQYFDAVRIDHVLGFFRIWEIPAEQLFGTMGHFSPALPLSEDEIEYFGLPFRRDFLTKPIINDRTIERLFGIHANYVREKFLEKKAYGLYALKPEVSTQRKIQALFDGRGDENSIWIRDGLYRLVANVLFLEDPRQHDMYHPRIGACQETCFEALSTEERDAYMRLYNNYFFQRHSMLWGTTGYQRLNEIVRNTRMLVCAEDLGMMPDCVAPVLDALRILTLEIQQMPKETGIEFSHLDGNPVRSVSTISTHDMSPLRLWWEESRERTQRFYATMLQKQGRAPEHLPAHLAEEIIARHLYSPSMICILSLQDWLAMDSSLWNKQPREERVNVPGDSYVRWQYRMHLTIEDLLKAEQYNNKLKTMITRSKR